MKTISDNVKTSVGDSVYVSVFNPVWNCVKTSVGDSVYNSVRDFVWVYVGSTVRDSVRVAVGDAVYRKSKENSVDKTNKEL